MTESTPEQPTSQQPQESPSPEAVPAVASTGYVPPVVSVQPQARGIGTRTILEIVGGAVAVLAILAAGTAGFVLGHFTGKDDRPGRAAFVRLEAGRGADALPPRAAPDAGGEWGTGAQEPPGFPGPRFRGPSLLGPDAQRPGLQRPGVQVPDESPSDGGFGGQQFGPPSGPDGGMFEQRSSR